MKIAMLGTRGVPARYSGFETCVEQLGSRLVERGHQVSAYCRPHQMQYREDTYKGMRLVRIPTIQNKYLETFVHSLLSALHTLGQGYDVGLFFIAGNSPVTWIPRLTGTKTILNVDGLDWRREKWPTLAKAYLKAAEYLATKLPNAYLTDSRAVQASYVERFGVKPPPYIPYGSELEIRPPGEILRQHDLTPERYLLFVGRLVPENCVHHLIEAFKMLQTDLKCVVVGGSSYAERYQEELKRLASDDPRIVLTGYLFGEGYQELGSNALIFVETSAVGGTHPALIEAMAFGNCVVVNNTPENLETVGDAGLAYEGREGSEGLRQLLQELLADPDRIAALRNRARARAESKFTWDAVTDQYERLFHLATGVPLPARLRDTADEGSEGAHRLPN